MLKKKLPPQLGWVKNSFHEYAITQLAQSHDANIWRERPRLQQMQQLSVMWIAYADRLSYANGKIQPVMDALEELVNVTDRLYGSLEPANSSTADMVRRFNAQNRLLFTLLSENMEEQYEELFLLGRDLLHRLVSIQLAFQEHGVFSPDYSHAAKAWYDRMQDLTDQFDVLALRHFYSSVGAGRYKELTALCVGSAFIRSVASSFYYAVVAAPFEREAMERMAFERHYDLGLLCSFGSDFDFPTFDDDRNILLPEVADLLY
jgi:hypothetical protein